MSSSAVTQDSTADSVSDDVLTMTSLPPPAAAAAAGAGDLRYGMLALTATVIALCSIILATVVGNAFVIAAIVLERKLRVHVANYLIASLAVADLLVALLVMPLAVVNEVSWRWFLGRAVCAAWTTLDLICCTSSILHLLAISVDRYWAVTRLDYIHHRSSRRIVLMIAASWTGSVVISAPPLFLDYSPDSDPDVTGLCVINENRAYTVFSTVGAFYLPFVLMMIVYVKVFRAAQERIRRKRFRAYPAAGETYVVTRVSAGNSEDSDDQPAAPALNGNMEQLDVEETQLQVPTAAAQMMASQQDHINGTIAARDVEAPAVDKSDSERRDDDTARHVPSIEEACGDDTGARPHHSCCSESDVITTSPWTVADDGNSSHTRTGEVSETQPMTMIRSCSYESPTASSGAADWRTTEKQLQDADSDNDDAFEGWKTQQVHRNSSQLGSKYSVSRPSEVGPTQLSVDEADNHNASIDRACTVGSPTDESDEFVARSAALAVSSSSRHMQDRLCLPRKAADRLLTPTSTPVHRASLVDLTRALFTSPSVLRVQLHGALPGAASRSTRQVLAQRRERKAARTLAVITGTFVLCWLPFFIVAILRPFCADECHYPALLISVIVWLGYANSLLNPVIYTVFNADFRSAFRKILFGKYRRHRR